MNCSTKFKVADILLGTHGGSLPRNLLSTRLVCTLRDIEAAIDRHRQLAAGLRLWQWNLFGYWHFGGEDVHYNVFALREDRLTVPNRDGQLWRPHLNLLGSGNVTPTPRREPMPSAFVRLVATGNRREAEPQVRFASSEAPWLPAPTEVKPPLVRHNGRSKWNRQASMA